jgi:hypothetical protein
LILWAVFVLLWLLARFKRKMVFVSRRILWFRRCDKKLRTLLWLLLAILCISLESSSLLLWHHLVLEELRQLICFTLQSWLLLWLLLLIMIAFTLRFGLLQLLDHPL